MLVPPNSLPPILPRYGIGSSAPQSPVLDLHHVPPSDPIASSSAALKPQLERTASACPPAYGRGVLGRLIVDSIDKLHAIHQ